MNFLHINKDNIHHLKYFLNNIGESSKQFRYYENRKPEKVIDNHMVTFLACDDDCVGYGHLDEENEKVWLGICVKDVACGKGYGKLIMNKLVNSYDGEIWLSVDSTNKKAIKLYDSFSFNLVEQKNDVIYMKRNATSI